MERADSNQLPEVDSLPEGFVDSPTESLAPPTPNVEQEKSVSGYQEGSSVEADPSNNITVNDPQSDDTSSEKTERPRTFPVPLCETDNDGNSEGLVQVPGSECREKNVAETSSEASFVVCQHGKERTIQGECQTTETGADVTHAKEGATSKNVDVLKPRKQDTSEGKRKGSKKILKTKKEILDFTRKYTEVLAERDAAVAARNRLESLCRVLQDQNKMLRDECNKVSTEGQKMRLDLSAKFQDAIKDVGIKLEEQKDECLSRLTENEMLRSKLKQLAEQYALSEQRYEQKLKQKRVELQIADVKIKQHEEKLAQEQSQMKVYADQVSQLLATEKKLRQQLTADGEKFQQFQDALVKSNEAFETFKQEIDRMSKSIKELRKENSFLKSKCEKSDLSLIQLFEEKEDLRRQLQKTTKQKAKLESLCRSLSAQRKQESAASSAPASESGNDEHKVISNE